MRTWLIIGAIVAAAVVTGLAYTSSSNGVPVEAAVAASGEVREFVDERAKTRLPRTYSITMPYAARILPIDLKEGTVVKAGQVVAQVVPKDLDLEVEAARAAVERIERSIIENNDATVEKTGLAQTVNFVESMNATVKAAERRLESGKAKLDYSLANQERLKSARNAITQDELERAELAVIESRVDYQQDGLVYTAMQAMQAATSLMPTTVRQYIARKDLSGAVLEKQKTEAEAKLKQVENDQQRGTMTSPVDGVVLERAVTDEGHLAAGTLLLKIGDLQELEVEADILSQDVVNVKAGNSVEIYGPAIGQGSVDGEVRRVYPAGFLKVSSLGVEQQRVKVIIAFDPEDLRRLRSERELGVDYRVRVRIFTAQNSQALTIPRSALFRGGTGEWQVFVVRNERARLQAVSIGLMNDQLVEVTKGLAADELVVLAPETNLTDGTKVNPLVRRTPSQQEYLAAE